MFTYGYKCKRPDIILEKTNALAKSLCNHFVITPLFSGGENTKPQFRNRE